MATKRSLFCVVITFREDLFTYDPTYSVYFIEAHATRMTCKYDMRQEWYEPQCEKTYHLKCAPNEDANQPAHPYSLISVFVIRMKKLCILGNLNAPVKILKALSDLNLSWAHMSEGTFSDFDS